MIETTGGNPDSWLHNDNIQNFAVIFKSAYDTPMFTGNYETMGVTEITFDARLDNENIPMYMSILLRSGKGTPADADDDDYVYSILGLIPQTPSEWESYTALIPSGSMETLPGGWSGGYSGDLENLRPGVSWNDVVTTIDRVEIWFWYPPFFGIFRTWDAGIDNVCITTEPGGVATEEASWGSLKTNFR